MFFFSFKFVKELIFVFSEQILSGLILKVHFDNFWFNPFISVKLRFGFLFMELLIPGIRKSGLLILFLIKRVVFCKVVFDLLSGLGCIIHWVFIIIVVFDLYKFLISHHTASLTVSLRFVDFRVIDFGSFS